MIAMIALAAALQAPALPGDESAVEIVVDASVTMHAPLPSGGTRRDAAVSAVRSLLDELPDGMRVGVRAYGHQSARESADCTDTAPLGSFRTAGETRAELGTALEALVPRGVTPLGRT